MVVERWSRKLIALGAVAGAVMSLLLGGVANADTGSRFTAQARAAGLTAEQAEGLQDKVDDYLGEVGGEQVAPNRIDLGGAVLTVTVPGEDRTRALVGGATTLDNDPQCSGNWARYGWFCAYAQEHFRGDNIGMYDCGGYPIPWSTTGSWHNNQTTGTKPVLLFTNDTTWIMPAASSKQATNVNWAPVRAIYNCR
ncbi:MULTISPECIES: hypothetical protein [Actinosynnema]|uniref:hypothetical protein n=1 Tax=Actinosynnema TaxID=40566 RepID=UPI0020A5AA21|nr:hypothetical protein [Actinosynnema pretiosum]MCP2095409.1 hypothetical protein [Actinosynnema pretiosum]